MDNLTCSAIKYRYGSWLRAGRHGLKIGGGKQRNRGLLVQIG